MKGFWGQDVWVDEQEDLVIAIQSSDEDFSLSDWEVSEVLLGVSGAFENNLIPNVPDTTTEPLEVLTSKRSQSSGLIFAASLVTTLFFVVVPGMAACF